MFSKNEEVIYRQTKILNYFDAKIGLALKKNVSLVTPIYLKTFEFIRVCTKKLKFTDKVLQSDDF